MPVSRSLSPGPPLNPSDELLLRSLHRFHYLTSKQLCRLGYSPASLTYVQTKLKSLTDSGYCQRIWLPRRTPYGSAPSVYTLGRRGLNHLRRLGIEVGSRFHPSEKRSLSYLFLDHTLQLNDFLIGVELLCQELPATHLAALRHEQDLKRTPVKVRTRDHGHAMVIPDAWLDLRLRGKLQVCLSIELDRGTEEQKRWRQKVANLVAFAGGPYQEAFQTRSLTIAVVTTAGDKRLLDLLRWTERELEELGEASQGDLFLFASLGQTGLESTSALLTRCWLQPFQQEPVSLLAADD